MLEFLSDFTSGFMGNIIGGPDSSAIVMGTLFLIVILIAILLAARVELELAMMIVSPAIIISSFAGLLPPFSLGLIIVVIAVFWAGVILAIIR